MVEKNKKLFKGRFTYVVIATTKQKVKKRLLQRMSGMVDKEINPSSLRKLFFALIGIFLATLQWKIFVTPVNHDLAARIIVFAACSIALVYLVTVGFFSRKYNYSICLDFQGLAIRDDYFQWADLKQTAILQVGSGKGQREYLILVLSDGSYLKYPLEAFLFLSGPGNAIASYIEYFKNNGNLS